VAACSGDDSSSSSSSGGIDTSACDTNSKCANEPPKTDIEKEDCRKDLTKCPTEFRAYNTCYSANEVCDGAGKTDAMATGAKCDTERASYVKCFLGGSSGGSDAGGG
jgi:hypothetical protein